MASGAAGTWYFNGENQVTSIGTSGTLSTTTADVIAFLPGVTLAICQSIHQKLGLSTTIDDLSAQALLTATNMNVADPNIDAGGSTITSTTLNGQPQGCFQKPAGTYIYYHVLVER